MSITEAYSLAVEQIADLATDAHAIEISEISNLAAGNGLPDTVPVGFIKGDEPRLLSVKSFIEEWRTKPDAKKGSAKALTLESFIALTIRHQTEHSVIFADTNWEKPSLTAIIDYHEATTGGDPDNCKHRIHYAFPLSVEWKAWIELNGKPMKQGDFAAFIEDRIADLTSPTEQEKFDADDLFSTTAANPSELVMLSRGLQVNVETKVKNATTLSSGEAQIVFEEDHRDASGGKLRVPGLFYLNIAPFFGGETARIPVRLRYRVTEGRLAWFYQIYRPDVTVTERVRADLARAVDETKLPAFEGTPEISA